MIEDAQFKSRDAASYDLLADSFDRHTERYSGYAVDRLLDDLDAGAGQTIIDIGCGSGIVSLALARRVPRIRVTGIDLSAGMLAFARAKADRLGLADRAEFMEGDAEALSLADESVDGAVSLYAWRHLPNPERATAEVFRVLRPGGRFALAVGSGPPLLTLDGVRAAVRRPARMIAQARGRELVACDHIDALVAEHLPVTAGDEAAAWTGAHHEYSGSIRDMLSAAGFTIESGGWIGRTYEVDSADDFWDLQTTFSSVARKRIAEASAPDRDRLKAAFDDQCARVQKIGGRLVYRVGAAVVCARKA